MDPIRILVADDHRFFREGVRGVLSGVEGIEVVSEAGTGAETIDQAERLQPDVVLMDLKMPDVNGIEATRRIVHTSPHVRVLVVTMYDDDDSVFAAMRAGAGGYVLKDADRDDLVRAIQAVSRGEAIFSPAIAQRMIAYFAAVHDSSAGKAIPELAFPDLTAREREILRFIARGHNNSAIAARLSLSVKTVQNHVSNIFTKLQVTDRAQAIVRAREAGLARGAGDAE
jgi:DNA-binding NarL/FixJ family response regulator